MELSDYKGMRSDLVAQKVIKNLEKRHMEGYYAKDKEEALKIALSLIPEGSTIGWGGSFSISDIGLKQALKAGNYTCFDRDISTDPEVRRDLMMKSLASDVFIMGTNAISEDGYLVNIDGTGNRVAALIYGPKEVIVLAGMNKLTRNLDDAWSRMKYVACPINAMRFDIDTPCKKTGACGNCLVDDCICGQIVVTRNCMPAKRIKVVLVDEDLGM